MLKIKLYLYLLPITTLSLFYHFQKIGGNISTKIKYKRHNPAKYRAHMSEETSLSGNYTEKNKYTCFHKLNIMNRYF